MNFTGNTIAVQLYSLRHECAADFLGTLERVKSLGYGAVEFAGLYDIRPEEVQAKLHALDLKSAGCHVSLDDLKANFNEIKRVYNDILNCDYITVPSGPNEFADGGKSWNTFCQEMRAMKKRTDDVGIKLAYHNHAFEFENRVGERSAFDVMFHRDLTHAPYAELDVCWVAAGNHDPIDELAKLKGRVKLMHVKDLNKSIPPQDTEVGSGVLEWPPIYKAAKDSGVEWLIVERDNAQMPAIDSVALSLQYLKEQGLETPLAI